MVININNTLNNVKKELEKLEILPTFQLAYGKGDYDMQNTLISLVLASKLKGQDKQELIFAICILFDNINNLAV